MLRPLYESAILRLTAATLAIGRLAVLPDESPDFDSIFKRFSETGESSLSDAFRFPTDLVPIGKGFLETLHRLRAFELATGCAMEAGALPAQLGANLRALRPTTSLDPLFPELKTPSLIGNPLSTSALLLALPD